MFKKLILVFGVVAVLSILAVGVYIKHQYITTSIQSVNTANIGELVELTVDGGSSYKWLVLPDTKNIRIKDDGRSLIFSATQNGEYIFICAMTKNGNVQLLIHKVVVGKGGPGPGPENDLESLVQSWLPTGYTKLVAEKLAHSLELTATSRQEDVAELIKITSISNRAALGDDIKTWEPFLKKFSEYCKANLSDKPLEDHLKVWLNVAAALRKVG